MVIDLDVDLRAIVRPDILSVAPAAPATVRRPHRWGAVFRPSPIVPSYAFGLGICCIRPAMYPVGSMRDRFGSPGFKASPNTLKLRIGPVAPGTRLQSNGLPNRSTTGAIRLLPLPLGVVSALPLITPGKNRKMPCRAVGVSTRAL